MITNGEDTSTYIAQMQNVTLYTDILVVVVVVVVVVVTVKLDEYLIRELP